jgi:hypothetical protein
VRFVSSALGHITLGYDSENALLMVAIVTTLSAIGRMCIGDRRAAELRWHPATANRSIGNAAERGAGFIRKDVDAWCASRRFRIYSEYRDGISGSAQPIYSARYSACIKSHGRCLLSPCAENLSLKSTI